MKYSGRIGAIILLAVFITAVVLKFTKGESKSKGRRESAPNVLVETPAIETIVNSLRLSGDVLPNRKVGIYARVSGNLDEVQVRVGDWVRSGQLLALIDTTELYQTYLQTAATYLNHKNNYDRNRELSARNLISHQELDNSKSLMEVAQAVTETARLRLNQATITAPFDGIITERFLDPGALVNANNGVLFILVEFETIKVMVEILERDVPKIRKGLQASVTVDAYPGETFEGVLTRMSESLDLKTRTMTAEIDVPNRDRRLKPGMFATASLILDRHPDVLTIPSQVILKSDEGYYIWVIKDGKSVRRDILVGWDAGARTEVVEGLSLADSVVTLGIQLLREGGSVKLGRK